MIPLNKYFPERNYGIVVRRGKFISPAARRFFELMDKDILEIFYTEDKIDKTKLA